MAPVETPSAPWKPPGTDELRRTVETADFTQGTLLPEGEQEELSSRAEDCSTPHKGQLPKVTRSQCSAERGARNDETRARGAAAGVRGS